MIHTRRARVGIVGMGHFVYWPQFEGLVDEFSLVIAPVADSGSGVSCFEQAPFLPAAAPVPFHLKSAETPTQDVLWLRYIHV